MKTRTLKTVWLRSDAVALLDLWKSPGESYSDVLLRLLRKEEGTPKATKSTQGRKGRDSPSR